MVPEHHLFFITGIEGDGLHSVGILVWEIVRRRDGQFCDLIGAWLYPKGDGSILAGGHVMLIITVNCLNPEHGAGYRGWWSPQRLL